MTGVAGCSRAGVEAGKRVNRKFRAGQFLVQTRLRACSPMEAHTKPATSKAHDALKLCPAGHGLSCTVTRELGHRLPQPTGPGSGNLNPLAPSQSARLCWFLHTLTEQSPHGYRRAGGAGKARRALREQLLPPRRGETEIGLSHDSSPLPESQCYLSRDLQTAPDCAFSSGCLNQSRFHLRYSTVKPLSVNLLRFLDNLVRGICSQTRNTMP